MDFLLWNVGGARYIRLSFAAPVEQVDEAVTRIVAWQRAVTDERSPSAASRAAGR